MEVICVFLERKYAIIQQVIGSFDFIRSFMETYVMFFFVKECRFIVSWSNIWVLMMECIGFVYSLIA